MNKLAKREPHTLASLRELAKKAKAYADESHSPRTRKEYAKQWAAFQAFAASAGAPSLPASPETLAGYLTHMAGEGYKVSTMELALAAISHFHAQADQESPRGRKMAKAVFRGIRRKLGTAQTRKAPLLVSQVKRLLGVLPDGLAGLRDRALILLGSTTGMRRSELVALTVEDLRFVPEGLLVTLPWSKTDQEGKGSVKPVPHGDNPETCAVTAVRAWLEASRLTEGPVFRRVYRQGRTVGEKRMAPASIAWLVKRYAKAAGLDPALFSGHSFRAGFVTNAAKAGKLERDIMKQTGHTSVQMLRRYIREAELWDNPAAKGIGF